MLRNIVGSVLALVGAAAVVWSPFRLWYDSRHGRDYRLGDLFSRGGITGTRAELFGSLFLPFVILALLALLGLVLRSRLLVALTGVVVLAGTVLWMVRVAQAEGELVLTADGRGVGDGVAASLGGGLLLLVAALVMSGHGRSRYRRDDPRAYDESRRDDPGPYATGAAGQPGPWQETGTEAGHGEPAAWDTTGQDRQQPVTWNTPPPPAADPYDGPPTLTGPLYAAPATDPTPAGQPRTAPAPYPGPAGGAAAAGETQEIPAYGRPQGTAAGQQQSWAGPGDGTDPGPPPETPPTWGNGHPDAGADDPDGAGPAGGSTVSSGSPRRDERGGPA
ncbi:hypothetical protein [Streptomyces sp. NPDC006552]|uniref:hypothetical protein n=1 Tax=Streptomyces sp. NPDC006552 TaxID=3157179 RepID=UPI0033BEC0EE